MIVTIQLAHFRTILGQNFPTPHCVGLTISYPVKFLAHGIFHVLRSAGSHDARLNRDEENQTVLFASRCYCASFLFLDINNYPVKAQ